MKLLTKFIFPLLVFTSCNVYELVDQGNKISDSFEELLNSPRITMSRYELSVTDINNAGSPGIDIIFTISNAQFNDTTTAGQVDSIAGAIIEGPATVTDLQLDPYVEKISSNKFKVNFRKNGANTVVMSGDSYLDIRVPIPRSAYTSNSSTDLEYQDYFIKLTL